LLKVQRQAGEIVVTAENGGRQLLASGFTEWCPAISLPPVWGPKAQRHGWGNRTKRACRDSLQTPELR
jgi:hypothetical protein